MCALYAMARRIDDVGDGVALQPGPGGPSDGNAEPDARVAALDEIRRSFSLLRKAPGGWPTAALPPGDPVLAALADTASKFPLPIDALEELVEGCSWDLTGRRYQSFDELVEYCRRVAGTIGRLSLAIYGSNDPDRAAPLADALGVALQLTNILRDVVEDRDLMGRVYLPADDLERFDVSPQLGGAPDDLCALICFESGRAAVWYERGMALLPMLDARSRACTGAMAGIYRRLLDRIRMNPESVLHGRVSLSSGQKAAVAAMALARAAA